MAYGPHAQLRGGGPIAYSLEFTQPVRPRPTRDVRDCLALTTAPRVFYTVYSVDGPSQIGPRRTTMHRAVWHIPSWGTQPRRPPPQRLQGTPFGTTGLQPAYPGPVGAWLLALEFAPMTPPFCTHSPNVKHPHCGTPTTEGIRPTGAKSSCSSLTNLWCLHCLPGPPSDKGS